MAKFQTGKAALTEAVLLFPQMHKFYLIACLLRTFGKGCRQRLRVASLARAGGKNQHLFIHRKTLLAFCFLVCYTHDKT